MHSLVLRLSKGCYEQIQTVALTVLSNTEFLHPFEKTADIYLCSLCTFPSLNLGGTQVFLFFNSYFLIGRKLLYNVVLVFTIQCISVIIILLLYIISPSS